MYARVIVEPPVEPLTLAEVKLDRAVDHVLHDALLSGLIRAAREYVERYCQISLVTQTREAGFDGFTCNLHLPYGPVQSIISVEYVGGDGVSTPITDYQLDLYAPVPRLTHSYLGYWPTSVGADLNALVVRYVAGYTPVAGSPTDYVSSIPRAIRTAMLLLVGNWYENREATVTGAISSTLGLAVESLLAQYRLALGMA